MDLDRVIVGHFRRDAPGGPLSEHGMLQEPAKGQIEPAVAAAGPLHVAGFFQRRLRELAEIDGLTVSARTAMTTRCSSPSVLLFMTSGNVYGNGGTIPLGVMRL